MGNNKSIYILKILLIIFVLILITYIVFLITNKNNFNNDKSHEQENSSNNNVATFEEGDIISDTKGSESNMTASNIEIIKHDDEEYTRIELSFDNSSNHNDIYMNQYAFQLVNEDKEVINHCFTMWNGDETFENIFPAIVLANDIKKGYLYCKCNDKNAKYLKITYIVNQTFEEKNLNDIETEEHYLEIQ